MDEIEELTKVILDSWHFGQLKRDGKTVSEDGETDISDTLTEMAKERATARVGFIKAVDPNLTPEDVVAIGKLLLEYENTPEFKKEIEGKDDLYYATYYATEFRVPPEDEDAVYDKFLEESYEKFMKMIVERVINQFEKSKKKQTT